MKVREAFQDGDLIWGLSAGDDDNGIVFICNHDWSELHFAPTNAKSNLYRVAKAYIFKQNCVPYKGSLDELARFVAGEYVKYRLSEKRTDGS